MKKKTKLIIIGIVIFIIGIGIGIFITNLITKNNNQYEELRIKKSPYTLEEIYEIVETPEKFYVENKGANNEFAYTLCHFYDYFNKSTPVKVAKKVEVDENKKVIKILEYEYLSYDEYMKKMKNFYQHENKEKEACKEYQKKDKNFECTIDYRYYAELLVGFY